MGTPADCIMSAIRAAIPAGVTAYDSIVPGVPTAKYVVASIPPGLRSAVAVDGVSDHVMLRFSTMCVASNNNPAYAAAECRWLQTTVRDALVDLMVTGDGIESAQVRHEGNQNPRPDETTPDKKVYATDQFSLETTRV